jgi:hypothetical protein
VPQEGCRIYGTGKAGRMRGKDGYGGGKPMNFPIFNIVRSIAKADQT